MKYSEFYSEAKRELTSTFISMFAKGKPQYADHLRWLFDNEEKEKLIQKPVFQSIFPWEPYDEPMSKLGDLLGTDYIDALDTAKFKEPLDTDPNAKVEDMGFHKDIHPYKHQVESWKVVLNDNKSIVVTTGTGSGKTECFMVPILKQLLESKKAANGNNPGIQAIFLYPLNALIASQRKRIHAWCDAVNPKVSYGVYTGDNSLMSETANNNKRNLSFPQIIDREDLRTNPPQILFTNPTMLEYMMVRKDDQDMVRMSNNLKWIILDEAHTYEGSKATEMAMLIRRVLQLFGKKPEEVNFAITSATIGEGKEEEMNDFISKLTGKDAKQDFRFITGKRIVPELGQYTALASINQEFSLHISEGNIKELRIKLNSTPALSLNEICKSIGYDGSTVKCLELIDELSKEGSALLADGKTTALLPVRAHFFGRSIYGLYACTNPECSQYQKNHIDIGTLTTFASQTCPHCGGKMLEVVKCDSCGEFLLQGERIIDSSPGADPRINSYVMKDNTVHLQHLLDDDVLDSDDDDDDDDNDNDGSNHSSDLLLSSCKEDVPFEGAQIYSSELDSINGLIKPGSHYSSCNDPNSINSDELLCPSCGEKAHQCRKLVFPSSLESRLLARTFLKQSPKNTKVTPSQLVYEGRKFITFTDNRQGTAKISQGANVDVEREWMRSVILDDVIPHDFGEVAKLQQQIKKLKSLNDNSLQPTIKYLTEQINQKKNKLSDWSYFSTNHNNDSDLILLKQEIEGGSNDDYLKAMFIDQMGNKPLRGNSLETLGLVHLDYPAIRKLGITDIPIVFKNFYGYADDYDALNDWKDFLRICIDYQIRRNSHLVIPDGDVRNLVTQRYYADPIYYISSGNRIRRNNDRKCKIWPVLSDIQRTNDTVVSRLPLLLLLGKGICVPSQLTQGVIDDVNKILAEAWNCISLNILSNANDDLTDGNNTYIGYKLNIFDQQKVKLSLIEKVTVCPMTSQILDCTFRGISPMAKGHLDPRTLNKYKIQLPTIDVPQLTVTKNEFTQNGVFDRIGWEIAVNKWFDEVYLPALQPLGGDYNTQRNLFLKRPIFITKEHSGQIDSDKLRRSEKDFENGKINVLSCSTTMEMGVDIGGISAVMMNNVPPKPANYLQRAGRAGRRLETQSLALTICNDNPIGHEVLDDPKWALDHPIEAPIMSFSSNTIMQRHINALLLGEYIRTTQGAAVSDQIGAFIYGRNYDNTKQINYTYDGYKIYLTNARIDNTLKQKIERITKGTIYENESLDSMISQSESTIGQVCDDLKSTIDFLTSELQNQNNNRYKNYLEHRIKVLWEHHLITYLSEHNYIPSASIPTNNARLVFNDVQETQRQLAQAIQEYTPGKEVVISNLVYPVVGIELKGSIHTNQSMEKHLSQCSKCGYVYYGDTSLDTCPQCGNQMNPVRNKFRLSIEPVGFIAGSSRRTKNPKLANDYVIPDLIGMESWNNVNSGENYSIRTSIHTDSKILYVNEGKGYGFAYCPYCGKMEPEKDMEPNPLPQLMSNHHDIRKAGLCYGNTLSGTIRRNVLLSACYHTDISEMEVKSDYATGSEEQTTLLRTLGTIICNTFTKRLGINSDEVWFGITLNRTLFFYDTTSGGAGYSNQLPMYIQSILDDCRNQLNNCKCDKACTSCLIDRRSQWFVQYLDKNIALSWLEEEYKNRQEVPGELNSLLGTNDILKITKDITSELISKIQQNDYQHISYFLKDGLEEDELFNKLEYDLKLKNIQGKDVSMVVSYSDSSKNLPMGIRMELNNMKARYSSLSSIHSVPNGILPIIQFVNGTNRNLYFSFNGCIYLAKDTDTITMKDYSVDLTPEPTDVCYVYEFKDEKINASDLLKTLFGGKELSSFLSDKNKAVSAKYSDVYISNPLACIILAHILNQFKKVFGLTIENVEIETGRQFKPCDDFRRQKYLDTDFSISSERDVYLQETLKAFDIKKCAIDTSQRLPHARLLSLYNDEFEITINPDGGFAQGWKAFSDNIDSIDDDPTKDIQLTNVLYRNSLPIRFTLAWRKK